MAILSVNLATRCWSDLGIVVLERNHPMLSPNPMGSYSGLLLKPLSKAEGPRDPADDLIHCEILPWNDSGPIEPGTLAGRLNHLCAVRGIHTLMLDGPQAWKSSSNGLEHARLSERQVNTAAKTGLPGIIKPHSYRLFTEFCLDLYDALCLRGWQRLPPRGLEVAGTQAAARQAPHADQRPGRGLWRAARPDALYRESPAQP
jgi:hypothetical protein